MTKISMWHIPLSSGWQAFCPSGLTQHQWGERRKTAGGKRLSQSDLEKKKKDKKIWIIRLAAFILNTKTTKLFEIYHTEWDKNLKLNVNQLLWRIALSLKPATLRAPTLHCYLTEVANTDRPDAQPEQSNRHRLDDFLVTSLVGKGLKLTGYYGIMILQCFPADCIHFLFLKQR